MAARVSPVGWVPMQMNGRTVEMWTDGRDDATREVFWGGRRIEDYEPETQRVLRALARSSEVIFDVGAHVGVHTLAMADANPAAQIFAIEPVPPICERLERNVVRNHLEGVVCVAAAAGDRVGMVPIFRPAGRVDMSPSTEARHRLAVRSAPFRCDMAPQISLDVLAEAANLDQVDLVKIDVELAELAVLRGMEGILGRSRPHIVCEVLPRQSLGDDHADALERVVKNLGYNIYLLTSDGPKMIDRVEGDEIYLNQLFTTLDEDELRAIL